MAPRFTRSFAMPRCRRASPLLSRGGVAATSKRKRRSHLWWSGRGGVGQKICAISWPTPPRLRD